MMIQIEVEPDIQELIRQRIESGAFRDASDVVASALRDSQAAHQSVLSGAKQNLYDFIRESPSMGSGIEFERVEVYPREIELESPQRKSLAQLFAESPFKGLDIEFPRDREPMRSIEL